MKININEGFGYETKWKTTSKKFLFDQQCHFSCGGPLVGVSQLKDIETIH